MDFYKILEEAIISSDVAAKEHLTLLCLTYCNQNEVRVEAGFVPMEFETPSYASHCTIVNPKELPARKAFDTPEGLATLVHAIAHIEYSAIDLALDAVYRFPYMPLSYKSDWLEVAIDEIRHFKMLYAILETLGYTYGSFAVHSGLFDAARHTMHSVLDRMAVVPRYYEASGLDVSPQILKKLENKRTNLQVRALIDALHIIYEEEIDHVQKGDKWFKFCCKQEGVSTSVWFDILKKYHLVDKHRPHINVQVRKEAGFTCEEIRKLGAKQCD
ncbi:MAG: ferritin-like domain-containing protein [Sulfurovum sp.]|nr:ferritin-like domain-containing protein [Sulfurovum sp.]